jgi:TPR repeat protein
MLSELYAGKFSPSESLEWCRKAAEAGHPHAQFNFGMTLLKDGSNSRNRDAALSWLEKAAHQDHVTAQFQLAIMYCTGQGVEKDLALGVAWYEQAALLGHRVAQYNLGVMLSKGQGCEKNPEKAVNWFEQAAKDAADLAKAAADKDKGPKPGVRRPPRRIGVGGPANPQNVIPAAANNDLFN